MYIPVAYSRSVVANIQVGVWLCAIIIIVDVVVLRFEVRVCIILYLLHTQCMMVGMTMHVPLLRIHHQKSRYLYELFYKRRAISRGEFKL